MAAPRLNRFMAVLVAGAFAAAGVAVGAAPARADDPVAGAQTAGDSLFPNQGNGGYDVSHYDIDLTVDVAVSSTNNAVATTTFPSATTTITAATTGAPLSSYSLDFQGSASTLAAASLNVDTVTVNGVPAAFDRIENTTVSSAVTDNHKLVVTPVTPVSGTFTTVVTYHGTPVRHADTDGSSEGWNNTTDGATFVNQPVGAMTAFPNNNTPRDKATYTYTIDVPSKLRTSNASVGGNLHASAVASNGELVSKTPNGDGSRTTWVWDETEPMATELSLISIGRYDVYESDVSLNSGRTLHEWTFIDPAASTQSQQTTQTTRGLWKPMLDFFETKYGPYPGNSIGYVTDVVPSAINYALETQDRSFFPNSASRGTAIHEVMHQWFGDNESPVDWNDIWLNEGPATYAETQVPFEALGASPTNPSSTETSLYNSWNSTAGTSSLWSSATVASMTQASQLFGSPTYTRGAMTLAALRTAIGDVAFETVMRQWQSRYGGESHRTADFIALAEEISGRDLTAFFDAWIYTTGKPAWPAKFELSLTGPAAPVLPGTPAAYTLTSRNTGKVAQTGSVVSVDLSDVLDDATVVALPSDSSLDGNTLTWNVPSTAVGTSSTATLQLLVNPDATGHDLAATATATTLGGTCADCTPGVEVGALPIVPAPEPTITGTPTVGLPLTATPGDWPGPTTLAYQWLVDDVPVPGATGASYTPGVYDLGLPVKVVVTGTLAGSATTSSTSAPTDAVVRGTFTSSPTPTIVGTPQFGVPMTASTGSWDPGTALTYQWAANGTNVSAANGGTGPSFTPSVAAQLGQLITVTVTGTKAGFATVSRTSAATAGVAAAAPLTLTPTPTVGGTPQVGVPLVAAPGQWDDGVTLTYQWAANGTNIGGATGVSFTPTATQLGAPLTVTVTGSRGGFTPVSRTSDATAAVEPGVQTLQPTPTVSGMPKVDVPLTAVPGTWDTGTTLAYQWTVDGSDVGGATTSTYTPGPGDVGTAITVKVTSTRTGYTTVTKESVATAAVAPGDLTLTPTPSFGGSAPKVGVVFTAAPGTWDAGVTLDYQWTADGADVADANALTYTVTPTDLGRSIAVEVTGSKPGYTSVTRTSPSSSAIEAGDQDSTPVPTITGTPAVGQPLTAVPGSWDDGVALTYQWTVAGAEVGGATDSTYTPVVGDAGEVVTVKVTGSKTGYATVTRESDPTGAVAIGSLTLTPTPTVAGSAMVGELLSATAGTWDDDVTLAYQWTADGADLAGATTSSYTVAAADLGKVVAVEVTGTKTGFATVTKQSAPTAAVVKGNLSLTPSPTIGGTPRFGETLVAVPGTWDAGTTFSYLWLADGIPVPGVVGSGYRLEAGDVGKSIVVFVTGTKAGYHPVTRASAGTVAVAALGLPDTTCTVRISGRAKVGKKLRAHVDDCPPGATLRYSWYAGSKSIDRADAATYKLKRKQAGKRIRVLVSISVPGYVGALRASDPTVKVRPT